jgi:hypothetical protein
VQGSTTGGDIKPSGYGPGFSAGQANSAGVNSEERPKDSVNFTGAPLEGGPMPRRKNGEEEGSTGGGSRVADNGDAGDGEGFRSARGSSSDIVSSFGGSDPGSKEASRRVSMADLHL